MPQEVECLTEQEQQMAACAHVPLIEQAWQTFLGELPDLLDGCRGQWVAYHGDQRIGGASNNPDDLYRQCLEKHPEHEFLIVCVEPGAGAPGLLPNSLSPAISEPLA